MLVHFFLITAFISCSTNIQLNSRPASTLVGECVEKFLHVMSTCVGEKTFIADYCSSYPISKDLEFFEVIYRTIFTLGCTVWAHINTRLTAGRLYGLWICNWIQRKGEPTLTLLIVLDGCISRQIQSRHELWYWSLPLSSYRLLWCSAVFFLFLPLVWSPAQLLWLSFFQQHEGDVTSLSFIRDAVNMVLVEMGLASGMDNLTLQTTNKSVNHQEVCSEAI